MIFVSICEGGTFKRFYGKEKAHQTMDLLLVRYQSPEVAAVGRFFYLV